MAFAEFPENPANDAPLHHGLLVDTLKSLGVSLAVMRKTVNEERPALLTLVTTLTTVLRSVQDLLTEQLDEQFVKVGQRTLSRRHIVRAVEYLKETRLDVWMQDGEQLIFKGSEALKLRGYLEHYSIDILHWKAEDE
jgi:hypothetical protein